MLRRCQQDIKLAKYLVLSETSWGAMKQAAANESRHSAVICSSCLNPVLACIYTEGKNIIVSVFATLLFSLSTI